MQVQCKARFMEAFEKDYELDNGKKIHKSYIVVTDPDANSTADRYKQMEIDPIAFQSLKLGDEKYTETIVGKFFKIQAVVMPKKDYNTGKRTNDMWEVLKFELDVEKK